MSYPKELLEAWKKVRNAMGPLFDDCHPKAGEGLEEIEKILGREVERMWDPNHDQGELCECGHTYDRHFDSWDDMEPVGCKYCRCYTFKRPGGETPPEPR